MMFFGTKVLILVSIGLNSVGHIPLASAFLYLKYPHDFRSIVPSIPTKENLSKREHPFLDIDLYSFASFFKKKQHFTDQEL